VRILRDAYWIALDFAFAARIEVESVLVRQDPREFLEGDLDPVVVIPGVYETWHFMRRIAERVHELGHPVHVLAELGHNAASFSSAAALATRYLRSHDLRHVTIVAHSKGGLIAKQMMIDDSEGRIDRLVALASPFAGSRYASFMLTPALRAFRPKGKALLAIAKNAEVNSRITSVYPEFDGHVPEGSVLAGARNIEVPVRGHFRVLGDDAALDAVSDVIADRPPREPARESG
jgi:alpha-beta hydrolase superfamily lysophospholipase